MSRFWVSSAPIDLACAQVVGTTTKPGRRHGREDGKGIDALADRNDAAKRAKYFAPEWIAEHAHKLKDLRELRVLDLGCGTGLNIEILAQRRNGIRAGGVDLSPGMLEEARATD